MLSHSGQTKQQIDLQWKDFRKKLDQRAEYIIVKSIYDTLFEKNDKKLY